MHFTNEAHVDPNQVHSKHILGEEGTCYEVEKRVKFYFAASISWHHKSPLEFYIDETDPSPVVMKKPPKLRKSKYETTDQPQQRLINWEACLSHSSEVKPKGNSMTQAYYMAFLLPVYAEGINEARVLYDRRGILQDNDLSHRT